MASDGADVTGCGRRPFQTRGPATGKARSLTVDSRVRRTVTDEYDVEAERRRRRTSVSAGWLAEFVGVIRRCCPLPAVKHLKTTGYYGDPITMLLCFNAELEACPQEDRLLQRFFYDNHYFPTSRPVADDSDSVFVKFAVTSFKTFELVSCYLLRQAYRLAVLRDRSFCHPVSQSVCLSVSRTTHDHGNGRRPNIVEIEKM